MHKNKNPQGALNDKKEDVFGKIFSIFRLFRQNEQREGSVDFVGNYGRSPVEKSVQSVENLCFRG